MIKIRKIKENIKELDLGDFFGRRVHELERVSKKNHKTEQKKRLNCVLFRLFERRRETKKSTARVDERKEKLMLK